MTLIQRKLMSNIFSCKWSLFYSASAVGTEVFVREKFHYWQRKPFVGHLFLLAISVVLRSLLSRIVRLQFFLLKAIHNYQHCFQKEMFSFVGG